MHKKVTDFFQQYAEAIQNKELTLLKSIYRLPFIIVQSELKSIVSSGSKLESHFEKALDIFEQHSITSINTAVKKAIHLSNDIHFANVHWTFKDAQGETKIIYNNSYMLSIVGDTVKVITIIIDDSNDTYLKLMD